MQSVQFILADSDRFFCRITRIRLLLLRRIATLKMEMYRYSLYLSHIHKFKAILIENILNFETIVPMY